jgi:hypothetical protein
MMNPILMIALSFHILAATFWAGSTFALVRAAGSSSAALFRPQMGAAAIAVLTGAYLWLTIHEGSFGATEQWLAAGASSAVLAFAMQATVAGSALATLRKRAGDDAAAHSRILAAHRVAAILLAGATAAMGVARYA